MKAQKIRTGIAEIIGVILTIIILAPFLLVVVNSAKSSADIITSPIPCRNIGDRFLQI